MGQRQAQGHTTAPSCAATSAKQSRSATFSATNVLSRCSSTGTQSGTAIAVDDLDPAEMMADVYIPNRHGLGCKPRGFGQASGPVQGEHEQLPQPLAKRVCVHSTHAMARTSSPWQHRSSATGHEGSWRALLGCDPRVSPPWAAQRLGSPGPSPFLGQPDLKGSAWPYRTRRSRSAGPNRTGRALRTTVPRTG